MWRILCCVFLAWFGGCAQARTYDMRVQAKGVPQLLVRKVDVTADATTVFLVYHNDTDQTRRIGVQPAGHKDAFLIVAPDGGVFRLVEARNIALLPDRILLMPDASREFVLVFAPLPSGLDRFRLEEGQSGSDNRWVVEDIVLR